MEIIIIAAMAANMVIGRGGTLPWHIPEDLQQFKEQTFGYPIVMGRKTYESIGRSLPGRINIVLSRNPSLRIPGCLVASSLKLALSAAEPAEKVFITGGSELYQQALALADTMILTKLARQVDGDVFFPDYQDSGFVEVERVSMDAGELCSLVTYKRSRKVA